MMNGTSANGGRRVALLILLLLPLAVPSRVQTQIAARGMRGAIEALNDSMVTAFSKDPSSVARFYADNGTIIGGGSRFVGRTQIDRYWADITGPADWKLEVLEVGGDTARPWVHGRSTLVGRSGRSTVTEFIGILQRQPNGALRYYIDMYVAATPRRTP